MGEYKSKRNDLEARNASVRTGIYVRNRGGSPVMLVELDVSGGHKITKERAAVIRNEYKELFSHRTDESDPPKIISYCCIDIDEYNGIDQGADGACTLVAMFNAMRIYKLDHLLPQAWSNLSKPSGARSWTKYWNKMNVTAQADLATCLDQMVSIILESDMKAEFQSRLVYVPIRSEGHSENMMNKKFALGPPDAALKLDRVMDNIGEFIEKKILAHQPVVMNFNGHSRVAIGFNDTHLLFADNWGPYWEVAQPNGADTYAAWFSVVDKRYVLNYVRGLAYFNTPILDDRIKRVRRMRRTRRTRRTRATRSTGRMLMLKL